MAVGADGGVFAGRIAAGAARRAGIHHAARADHFGRHDWCELYARYPGPAAGDDPKLGVLSAVFGTDRFVLCALHAAVGQVGSGDRLFWCDARRADRYDHLRQEFWR